MRPPGPRFFRILHHAFTYESRYADASEITGWSNALAALAIGAGGFSLFHSWVVAPAVAVLAYCLLRLALANRVTVWIAAAVGTLSVATAAATIGWLFGHVAEVSWAPVVAAASSGVLAAILPARSYMQLARARARDVRDSLIDPISIPRSR